MDSFGKHKIYIIASMGGVFSRGLWMSRFFSFKKSTYRFLCRATLFPSREEWFLVVLYIYNTRLIWNCTRSYISHKNVTRFNFSHIKIFFIRMVSFIFFHCSFWAHYVLKFSFGVKFSLRACMLVINVAEKYIDRLAYKNYLWLKPRFLCTCGGYAYYFLVSKYNFHFHRYYVAFIVVGFPCRRSKIDTHPPGEIPYSWRIQQMGI